MDGTLLDFVASERCALKKVFALHGFELSDEDADVYSKINDSYWTKFDNGEIEKGEIYSSRFRDFYEYIAPGREDMPDWRKINEDYQVFLGEFCFFKEDSLKVVTELSGNFRQYIVTNGSVAAQVGRLKLSGFDKLMDGIFISEEMGQQKPNAGFFDACFEKLPECSRDETIIIGDSLTSDIQGGNNAGIMTCWYNPDGKPRNKDVKIDYEIRSLREVYGVLGYEK